MHKVVRYTIPTEEGLFSLNLPRQTKILSIKEQRRDTLQLWALINQNVMATEKRNFLHVASETPIEQNASSLVHIETFFLNVKNYVGHIFEVK